MQIFYPQLKGNYRALVQVVQEKDGESGRMVCIVDYGCGNLRSVVKAVQHTGVSVRLIRTAKDVPRADKIILPGVGAFSACMAQLKSIEGMVEALGEFALKGKPLLGICVGMQILATSGHEFTVAEGLDLVGGRVRSFNTDDPQLKIPHMGWSPITCKCSHPVLKGLDNKDMYFVHSYIFDVQEPSHVLATCTYGEDFPAIIGKDAIIATQFHPEKSQRAGLQFFDNFVKWKV